MEKALQLDIVTPDQLVLNETVSYVGAPGFEGEFGVLPNHVPYLTALSTGILTYHKGKNVHKVFVSGGFVEVSDNKMMVLADSAETAEEIDRKRAEEAKQRAEKRLTGKPDGLDMERAHAALVRAVTRLSLLG